MGATGRVAGRGGGRESAEGVTERMLLTGVGLKFKALDRRRWLVHSVKPGYEEAIAGLVRSGDVLVSIDGQPVDGLSQDELAAVCLGPEGSVCQVCILRMCARGSSTEERHVSITRKKM